MLPIFLNLQKISCLVVGGGSIAWRKTKNLINEKALITVVAKEPQADIRRAAQEKKLKLQERSYCSPEAACYFLTIAATDDALINRQISSDAIKAGRLVNCVDRPELCNFYSAAALYRGNLCLALSTNGKAPVLSKWLRRRLEKEMSPAYADLVKHIAELRTVCDQAGLSLKEKSDIIEGLLNSAECERFLKNDRTSFRDRLNEAIASTRAEL